MKVCSHVYIDVSNIMYGMVFHKMKEDLFSKGQISKNRFETGDKDFPSDPSIIDLYYKHIVDANITIPGNNFLDYIERKIKTLNIYNDHYIQHNYCFDCKHDNGKYDKNSIYQNYKIRKTQNNNQELFKNACKNQTSKLFEFLKDSCIPGKQAYMQNGLECDDIIADHISEKTKINGPISGKIIIISSDSDYFQLQMNPNVFQLHPFENKFLICSNPYKSLMDKIILGDRSDNVPNMLSENVGDKKITKKLYEDIVSNFDTYKTTYAKYYERNKSLVNLIRHF